MHFPEDQPERRQAHQIGIPEVVSLTLICILIVQAIYMIHHDTYVNSSTYSNRSFAGPAAGLSFVIVTYTAYHLKRFPWWARLLIWPFAFFIGYAGIGVSLISLNQAFK